MLSIQRCPDEWYVKKKKGGEGESIIQLQLLVWIFGPYLKLPLFQQPPPVQNSGGFEIALWDKCVFFQQDM